MNNSTSGTKRRLKTQMKAIRMASSYLVSVGAGGNSIWEEFFAELQRLKVEYRYITYEENHGSLAAEMVVGEVGV
jgi:hypothetical protein